MQQFPSGGGIETLLVNMAKESLLGHILCVILCNLGQFRHGNTRCFSAAFPGRQFPVNPI
jgi:hypothetical protein